MSDRVPTDPSPSMTSPLLVRLLFPDTEGLCHVGGFSLFTDMDVADWSLRDPRVSLVGGARGLRQRTGNYLFETRKFFWAPGPN